MAEVVPFQGIRYNPDRIGALASVVAPPYDVISPAEQKKYHQRHPNNIVHLELGLSQPDDDKNHNVYTRAGDYFQQWLREKILVRDPEPCFYLTAVDFVAEGHKVTRYGIISLVRLQPFDQGVVLPHERTFSKVKSERLQLMKACHANLSSIFGLYSDTGGLMPYLRSITDASAPEMKVTDDRNLHHRLWRVSDPRAIDRISDAFRDARIYIADGHHRYETALNYRDWVRSNTTDFSSSHPSNFIMMSLSSLEDPGMVILPAHRLLKDVSAGEVISLLEKAAAYFDTHTIDLSGDRGSALTHVKSLLEANAHKSAVGLMARDPRSAKVLIVKDGAMDRLFADEFPEPLRVLDVTVLTHLILMKLLGFTQAELDDATRVDYRTTLAEAAEAVESGEADLAFLLNPTKIEQVRRVSEHGLIMPRKSTYFYPKVVSGLVLNSLKA